MLDLGYGAGKICYIAAQIAGPEHQSEFAKRLSYDNLVSRDARIRDLALSLDEMENYLKAHPVRTAAQLAAFTKRIREATPSIADDSVVVVVSNCVLNLVPDSEKTRLFSEIHRVLKPGGRAAISDIVSDADVPAELKADAALWSGCVSGALGGIQFRAVTVRAWKGKEGPCLEVPHVREIPLQKAQPFACRAAALRDPRETKGKRYRQTTAPDGCAGEGCC